MSLAALESIDKKIIDLSDEAVYFGILDRAGIRCRLVNIWGVPQEVLDGSYRFPERDRYVIPLPLYHGTIKSFGDATRVAAEIGRTAVTLDEYVDICRQIFALYKERGAVGMKDQSAYTRTLRFENATRGDAEKLFNSMMDDPRVTLG